jgi:hypothetical protein
LKKLKAVNFTINEVKEFLKNYPVEKIIEALEDKVSRDIVKII